MKKIIAFCMAFILSFCCLPVLSFASIVPDDYPTQLPFVIRTSEAEFYTDLSSTGVIENVLHSDPVVNSFVNGSDFSTPVITSDATAFRITFLYDFDDPSYVDGQTYRFSFKVNEPNASTYIFVPQDNYRTATVIANAVYNTLDQIKIGSVFYERDFYDLTVAYNVEFSEPNIIKTGLFEFTDTVSIDLSFDNIYSASVITQDPNGNYIPDYTQPMVPQIPITFFLVFRNSALTQLTLSDVTLSPIGHTKSLYDDVFFQEGMLGGMQDLEDQMSDVNQNLDDIEGILNGEGETYAPLPEESYFNEYHEAESEYNKDFSGELGDLIGDADGIFDSVNGSSAFSFITSIFDDIIVSNSKINGLILFCLSLGLCVLILGRRLNSA